MSADDNELDYLHVPRGDVDKAITEIENAMKVAANVGASLSVEGMMRLVVKALRELHMHKRSR